MPGAGTGGDAYNGTVERMPCKRSPMPKDKDPASASSSRAARGHDRPPHEIPAGFEERESPRVEIAHGLLDAKHRIALGPAWHLYIYLLSRKPFRTPYVAGGRVVPIWLLAWCEQTTERQVKRWLRTLREKGYIHIEAVRSGRPEGSGVRIRIMKAKEWRGGKMRVFKDEGVGTKVSPPVGTNLSPPSEVQATTTKSYAPLPQNLRLSPSVTHSSSSSIPVGAERDHGRRNAPEASQRPAGGKIEGWEGRSRDDENQTGTG